MYETIKLIGRGANGDVYLSRKIEDNSTQVIKRLKIRDVSERQRLTIQTQLKLLKQFKHVNIVPFRDSYIDAEGNLNIVMGYCEGGDMHNLIQLAGGKKFQQKKIVDWIVQLALSIFYLHQRRVLHRDIKTQNVFLTNGRIMLGDFGVSKVLDQAADLTCTNIGTPYYMSPEQYRQKPYSYKSDIWAFGCIIYQMCNHKHVFEALTLQALAVKVMKGIYAPVSEQYSKQLRSLVNQMLKQNPKERPSIRQILTRPFLFGKVQNYMKKIYSEKEKYEPEVINSLIEEAKSLGFSLQQQKPKRSTQASPKKSKVEPKQTRQSKLEKSKEKLKHERQRKYQELKEKLRRQIQQRNRAQEQLKKIERKNKQKKKDTQKYSIKKPHKSRKQQISISDRSSISKLKSEDGLTQAPSQKNFRHHEQQTVPNFKIEEDYDMDYEQYSDKQDNQMNKIVEVQQQQEKHVQKIITKPPVLQYLAPSSKQKAQNATKVTKEVKQQIKKPEDEVVKADQLSKEVKQKTIIISSIRNQISKLDFVLSSDSEQNEQEKIFNPAFTRISQKINDLKQKVISHLGRNGYTNFLNFVYSNIGKTDRNKVIQMVGQQNIGVWQIAENIVKLDRVLSKIPTYISK